MEKLNILCFLTYLMFLFYQLTIPNLHLLIYLQVLEDSEWLCKTLAGNVFSRQNGMHRASRIPPSAFFAITSSARGSAVIPSCDAI